MKNAKAYLAIDTVLVCCLLALTMAPGLVELLAALPESVTMGIGLVLLLASDYYWVRAALTIRGIKSRRVLCFLLFAFLTLINLLFTLEMIMGVLWSVFHLS